MALSTSLLEAMFRQVPFGVVFCDAGHRFRWINAAGCEYIGRERDEALGQSLKEHLFRKYSKEFAEEAFGRHEHVLRTGKTFDSREWGGAFRQTFSRGFLFHTRISRIENPETGEPEGTLLTVLDTRMHVEERRAREQVENRLQALLDAGVVGVLVSDRDRLLEANDAALAILGVARADILSGKALWRETLAPESRDLAEEVHRQLLESQKAAQLEATVARRNGERRRVLVSIARVSQEPYQAVVLLIDVTEREALRAQLKDEQALLEAVIDQMPDSVVIGAHDSSVLRMNRVARHYFGEPPEGRGGNPGPVEMTYFRSDGTPYTQSDRPILRAVKAGETISGEEVYVPRSDGTKEYFLVSAAPIRRPDGQVIAGVATAHRITERKREELHEKLLGDSGRVLASSLDLQTIFQALADLVVPEVADWCNFAFARPDGTFENIIVNYADPAKQALSRRGARASEKVVPNDPRAYVISRREALLIPEVPLEMSEAAAVDEEARRYHRELGIRSAMFAPLICRGECIGTLSFFSSRPGRKYDPRDLELLKELARRFSLAIDSSRLYSRAQEAIRVRDEFLSIASHELKTPLTSLKLQLLLARQAASEAGLARGSLFEKLDVLERQSDRLWTLVEDLLDMSRIRAGRFDMERERIKLAEVVRDAIQRQASLCEAAGCRLEVALDETLVGEWDRSRLDQVMVNLISNALKYGAGKPIRISLARKGSRALFSVKDEGIGIQPTDLERIFNRFERAVSGEHFGGLGLGLYIARQIVEAHGGTLHVESEVGKGACFTVDLPLDPALQS